MPVIVDVPLLFEASWHAILKTVILVYVPVEVQITRLMARDSLSREKAEMNVAMQMSIEEKRERSTFIIDNSGTVDDTKRQVLELFKKLCCLISQNS